VFRPGGNDLGNKPAVLRCVFGLGVTQRALRIAFRPACDEHRHKRISFTLTWQVLDCVDHRPHIFRIKVLDQFVNFAVDLAVSRMGCGVFDRNNNIF
jgi:hypothetical protein